VFLLHPLILQTLAIPPHPNESASLPKNNRFCFSFNIGIIRFIRKSGLIPRGLPRLKQRKAHKNLVLNQTV
jgi:hypothetical protein